MPEQAPGLIKRPTGIAGFDAITHGGLPQGRITLLQGDAGAGKTLFALQVLANAAAAGENGLFVAFEESSADILNNVRSLDWNIDSHLNQRLFMVDGRPPGQVEVSGEFDISGLTAALAALADRTEPAWVVLDGIDQLLALEGDARRVEGALRRLLGWLQGRDLAVLLTAKESSSGHFQADYLDHLRFQLNTVITLSARLGEGQRLSRRLRVAKYRGSAHVADDVPLLIDAGGVVLPYHTPATGKPTAASTERVSSGIKRLDTVLGGGYFRGTATLVMGEPGTSKTSLSAAFALAAARRDEKTVYISFDESGSQIVRNMRSIGMDLQPHLDSGILKIVERRSWQALAEAHFLGIVAELDREQPRCLVIDPLSALNKAGGDAEAQQTVERLMDLAKERGITSVVTSLVESDSGIEEASAARVSTVADTWLALRYQIHEGERNRSLSVVKSRGSAHSNQLRELVVSDRGMDLADVYAYGSKVLMGTARLHHDHAMAREEDRERQRQQQRRREREQELRELQSRVAELEGELRSDVAEAESGQQREQRMDAEIKRSRFEDARFDQEQGPGEEKHDD